MSKTKCARDEIITMAGNKYVSKRVQQNRLDTIVEWLCNSTRAARCLEWETVLDSGDYFLNIELNLTNSKSECPFGSYSYNVTTAIMLATLLDTYETRYFTSLLKDKYVYFQDSEDWMDEVEQALIKYEPYWINNGSGGDWETVSSAILSLLYRLTLPDINFDLLETIDQMAGRILIDFLSLPDDKKIDVHEQIKRRLDWIANNLKNTIEGLDSIDKINFESNREMV